MSAPAKKTKLKLHKCACGTKPVRRMELRSEIVSLRIHCTNCGMHTLNGAIWLVAAKQDEVDRKTKKVEAEWNKRMEEKEVDGRSHPQRFRR